MSVSVIIPMYNAAATIKYCVESAASPEVEEILLVDDGSTDGTLEKAEQLKHRHPAIRILRQSHGGVSAARNIGLREARGDWVIFLDADDSLMPSAVQKLAGQLRDGADACCGGILRGKGGRGGEKGEVRTVSGTHAILNAALESPTDRLTVHGWIFRRRLCVENELFFRPSLRLGEDSEWVLRVLACCEKVKFLSASVYRYTISPESAVHKWKAGQTKAYLETLEEIGKTSVREEKNWPVFVLTTLLLILTHDTFHPANPASGREKLREAGRLRRLPVFAEAFSRADLSCLGMGKRITLECLRAGMIRPVRLAVRIRQLQNARAAGKKEREPRGSEYVED